MRRRSARSRESRIAQYNKVVWPTTPEGWCEWFQHLDLHHGTTRDSPLHHDNRCSLCKGLTAG